ncbi:MAG: DUF2085 domain-containing protein [Candidatus Lokiarchaeota archaeon]|nr:DUF2085 domain-containing protein [Candidatus Lokiarchaeota archaeon]
MEIWLKKFFSQKSGYKFTVCHRIPERSFFFRGKQFPLCSRCTGIVLGYWLYPFFIFNLIRLPLLILILLHLPLFLDGITQIFCSRESTNSLRFITGFFAGMSQVGIMDFSAEYLAKLIHSMIFF